MPSLHLNPHPLIGPVALSVTCLLSQHCVRAIRILIVLQDTVLRLLYECWRRYRRGSGILGVLDERGVVEQGEENTAARPRELVAEGVTRAFRSGKTAAVGVEFLDLKTIV